MRTIYLTLMPPSTRIISLVVVLLLIGGGYWWFTYGNPTAPIATPTSTSTSASTSTSIATPTATSTPSPTPSESPVIEIDDMTFTHEIGKTKCPTFIGTIDLSWLKQYGKAESIRATNLPNWLQVDWGTGGLVGKVYFTCKLDNYVTQDLSQTVHFNIYGYEETDPEIGSFDVKISGHIQAQ